MASPIVHILPSRGSIEIDTADLIVDGRLSINAAVEDKGYFSVHYKGRTLELTAGGFCGLIPINDRISIDVRPKMPVANLSRVFDVAMRPLVRIDKIKRTYDQSFEHRVAVMDFLANEFLVCLRVVIATGLHKAYIQKTETSAQPRGRILLRETFRSWGKGDVTKLTTSYFEQSLNIPENRLIKGAALVLLSKLNMRSSEHRKIRRELGILLRYFNSVSAPSGLDMNSITQVEKQVATLPPHRSDVLKLATILLRDRQVHIDTGGGRVDLSAVVINFDELFEDYVRNVLVLTAKEMALNCSVAKGKKGLFDDQKKPEAEPDVVITDNSGQIISLIEVKYKSWPARPDQNQAITYGASYRVNNVFLLHQADDGDPGGMALIGAVGDIKLFRYGLKLSSSNLKHEESELAKAVFGSLFQAP